jgi:23S rRNA pseudoU1915 N3-methylase RlmH
MRLDSSPESFLKNIEEWELGYMEHRRETQFRKESLDFLQFLKNLAFRNPGDNTTLAFNGERIKIGLVLVAKKGTYIHKGIDAYIRRIEKNITLGIQRMFILSYAQRYDEVIEDAEGYVAEVKRKKDFVTLNLLEQECRKRQDIRLIKKQKYRQTMFRATKDPQSIFSMR